ncbi:MAG: cytidine deaminase [Lachnospiraceae bacterium]|nr:cytidine deaminase [Lachnospiraceae bacterium]
MTVEQLIKEALLAREQAYAPYSGFAVGAALLCDDGAVFHGCNVENVAYGDTMCAERTAFFQAIANGQRNFRSLAIVGGKMNQSPEDYCYPCGSCRQVIAEFVPDDFEIVVAKNATNYKIFTMSELLPGTFRL